MAGIPVHRVSVGNLRQDLLDAVRGKRARVANPSFFVRNRDEAGEYDTADRGGMLWRSCTRDYKVLPIRRVIRALAEKAHGSARLPAGCAEQWFGISLDEWRRMDATERRRLHREPLPAGRAPNDAGGLPPFAEGPRLPHPGEIRLSRLSLITMMERGGRCSGSGRRSGRRPWRSTGRFPEGFRG